MNERFVELVNREIDGLLSADEQRELNQLVAASTEARRFHESHVYAAGLLKNIPVAAAPQNLKGNIMSAVRKLAVKNPSQDKARKPRFSFAKIFQPASAFPLAVGMAAGILLTVIFWGNEPIPSINGIGMTGTLVDWSAKEARTAHSPIAFTVGNAEVSVRWIGSENGAIVFVDIAGNSEAIIGIHAPSAGLPILSVAQKTPGIGGILADADVVEITHSGTNSYAVAIDRGDSRSLPLEITVSAGGETVSQPLVIEWR